MGQLLCIAAVLVSPTLSHATLITNFGPGTFNAGNSSVAVTGGMGVMAGCIDWYNGPIAPTCPQPTGVTAMFSVDNPSAGPFNSTETGTIQDLNLGVTFPVVNFISIMTPSGLAIFDLKDLRTNTGPAIGDCTPGTGDMLQDVSCTPAGSPFTIINGANNPATGKPDTVSIVLTADLYGYIGSSGVAYNAANPYVGVFTTQFALSGTIDSIESTILSGGTVTAAWSAAFAPVAAVPEPATFGTIGFSLIGVGYLLRRRIAKG